MSMVKLFGLVSGRKTKNGQGKGTINFIELFCFFFIKKKKNFQKM